MTVCGGFAIDVEKRQDLIRGVPDFQWCNLQNGDARKVCTPDRTLIPVVQGDKTRLARRTRIGESPWIDRTKNGRAEQIETSKGRSTRGIASDSSDDGGHRHCIVHSGKPPKPPDVHPEMIYNAARGNGAVVGDFEGVHEGSA